VEAPAQGDEGGTPEEVENPGEHRALDGLNTRLGATNFRGEKGPEDEPISQSTACLRSVRARTSVRRAERTERTRSESASPASAGGTREGRKMDVEPGFRSVIDEPNADRPIPRPTVARAMGGCSPRDTGFGRYSIRKRRTPADAGGRCGAWYPVTASVAAGSSTRQGREGGTGRGGQVGGTLRGTTGLARRRSGSRTGGSWSSWPVALRHHRPGRRVLRHPEPARAPASRRPRVHRKRGTQRRASARPSVTAARWGRQTGSPPPGHGSHCTPVQQGQGRVEMSPRGRADRRQECGTRVRPCAAPAAWKHGFSGRNGPPAYAGAATHFGATRQRRAPASRPRVRWRRTVRQQRFGVDGGPGPSRRGRKTGG
jgi:hypothetical protein